MGAHLARQVTSPESSRFFQRLEALTQGKRRGRSQQVPSESTSLSNLCNATRELLASATAISDHVVRYLPQFTLHNGKHLWNVLTFMEELAGGEKGINKLGAGDCAMAIWAAFIHDLGMVLDAQDLAALDAADHYDSSFDTSGGPPPSTWSENRVQAWRAYRDASEHWASIRQAFSQPQAAGADREQASMRLGIIRAAFIRDSHARDHLDSGNCRIADWLKDISQSNRLIDQALADYAVEEPIVRVAVSHNQAIDWLPRQFHALNRNSYADDLGSELGVVHWAWIGWLLRLADVFDCDASRTPRVWFEQGGITDARSQTEWRKHLAIREAPKWEAESDVQTLLYTCQKCPSPIVEKALRETLGWMNDEIQKVHTAKLDAPDPRQLPLLRLPSRARVDIKQRDGGYLYHDMEFNLDRDAVVELLMGESLYGGPELALRELVQNALDAVHLREQRNRLAAKLRDSGSAEKSRQPHQPWESGEKPGVDVTWGFDPQKKMSDGRAGCHFIRVSDNGVGMTVGVMRRFLTRIGRSYYKSDEFRAEQELMRRHGILCSAISQFGIGFLSVFMLADEVTIHTRPVGVTEERPPADATLQDTARFPFRAEIHGPHGLLAFYPDRSRETQSPGTTVTVWLKESFVIPDWDPELLKNRLRKEFYAKSLPEADERALKRKTEPLKPGQKLLDVGFEIGRFIVWPHYPVRLSAAGQPNPVVIDDAFHHQVLVPLDRDALRTKACEWDHEIPEIEQTNWQVCDWIDEYAKRNGGVDGTGTRIRLIGPHPETPPNGRSFTPREWSALSEQLVSGEPRLLLGNYTEPQLPKPLNRYQCLVMGVRIIPGFVPSRDERDCKLPGIIERLPILPGEGGWVWIDLRGAAMPRLRADRSAPTQTQGDDSALANVWNRWQDQWSQGVRHWQLSQVHSQRSWHASEEPKLDVGRIGLPRVTARDLSFFVSLEANTRKRGFVLPFDPNSFVLPQRGHFTASRTMEILHHELVSLEIPFDFADRLAYSTGLHLSPLSASERRFIGERSRSRPAFSSFIQTYLASEGLSQQVAESHPAAGLNGHITLLSDHELIGPVHVGQNSRIQWTTTWIGAFDLVAPFTAIPLTSLRRKVPDWSREPSRRRVGMLPFMIGSTKINRPNNQWNDMWSFDTLQLFMPNPDHWEWLFADHTRDEWNQGSASALWDLKTGDVLYADGVHDEASLRRQGKPLKEWLEL